MLQKRTHYLFAFFLAVTTSLTSCMEKNTTDAIEAYNLWGGEVPKEVEVINGNYWQSAHFTKEYIMSLELKASPLWRKELIKQNNLVETKERTSIPSKAPTWFKPTESFKAFTQSGFSQGSVYFEDTVSGRMFIYEIQL
jgi:hypothetical protein